MLFLRWVLILIGMATGFFFGGHLTQNIVGACIFSGIALLLMVLLTRPLKKKAKQSAASPTPVQEAPEKRSGKKRLTIGRVVWSIITAVGVSGVIAILTYVQEQKDRERDRRYWAEQQYQKREDQLRQQLASSIAGRVFDRRTNAPLGNTIIGYMSQQGFRELARTAPDGSFRIDRPFLTEDHYPIRIAVIAPNAGGTIHYTNEYLQYAQQRQNVNIYVLNQSY